VSPTVPDVPEIDVAGLAEARTGGAPLIDVRQPEEWEEFRAPGAVLIPLGELLERIEEVPTEGTVYVICRTGARSAKAVAYLRSVGIDAVNVAGGTLAWHDAALPIDSGAA
jgi:rhodanese-related sulfurtransferase